MKTTSNLKTTSSRRYPSLPLLVATMALLAFAPQPVWAGDQVPFKGSFNTEFTSVLEFPYLHITVTGAGNASHMGATDAFTDDQLVNVIDGSATATYTLTAANGDNLVLAMIFQATNIPGGVTFAGDYTVAGGTGRFVGATGSGVLAGTALFTSETDGIGSFSVVGTISR